jgi:IclR family acetate operon transcriptional repressor
MPTGPDRNPLSKVVRLLRWMVEADGSEWGVREIARALEFAPSTTHRLIGELQDYSWVSIDPVTGRCSLGHDFLRLSARAARKSSLPKLAEPILAALTEATNETSFLGVYDNSSCRMAFTASVESRHEIRYVVTLDTWTPLYRAASGHAILAFVPDQVAAEVLDEYADLEGDEARAELIEVLGQIRRRGYAFTSGQKVAGAVGVAAPVFGASNRTVGDIGLSVPSGRYKDSDASAYALLVLKAARELSELIGGSYPVFEE